MKIKYKYEKIKDESKGKADQSYMYGIPGYKRKYFGVI